jgi:tRNA nucleotidyltransferase (CCA-adding enzyme)
MLRAIRFASVCGWKIAPETWDAIRAEAQHLGCVSIERIRTEFIRTLCETPQPSLALEMFHKSGLLARFFPELISLRNCLQDPIWHPEGDVWNHTMRTLDAAVKYRQHVEQPEYYMVSALCHDMGKPLSVSIDDNGCVHTYRHDEKGVPVATEFLARLNNDKSLTKYTLDMVEKHMTPHNCFDSNSRIKSTNAMYDRSICPNDLMYLAVADTASRGDEAIKNQEYAYLQERLLKYEDRMKQPEVGGADLIKLGIKPGPHFSSILENAHKQHLSGVDKDKVLQGIETTYKKQVAKAERAAMFNNSPKDVKAFGE